MRKRSWAVRDQYEIKAAQALLAKGFRALRKVGYIARQNFLCCESCGAAAIWQEFEEKDIPENQRKRVSFCEQRRNSMRDYGSVYVSWDGDGHEICSILKSVGLATVWDGSNDKSIEIVANGQTKVHCNNCGEEQQHDNNGGRLVCSTCGTYHDEQVWQLNSDPQEVPV